MTKTKRILNILQALFLILMAAVLFTLPIDGVVIVVAIVGIGLSIKGIGTLIYYFQMARYMVGGKIMLYRGLITWDLGLFICSLAGQQGVYLILCTTAINAVAGVFSILKAFESKRIGSWNWVISLGHGILLIALMVIVVFSWIFQNQPTIATYVYAFSLILTAFQKIITSFKKTAIAYIP